MIKKKGYISPLLLKKKKTSIQGIIRKKELTGLFELLKSIFIAYEPKFKALVICS